MFKEKLQEIIDSLASCIEDAEKSESGNAAAGRRVRKVCMSVTKDLKHLRASILEHSKK